MNEILLNILSVVVTSIILPLLTYAGTRLIAYLNSKIKDENYRIQLTTATDIVVNAVRTVFQTYVDSLKVSGNFDKEAQLIALNKAKDIALEQMTDDVKKFINREVRRGSRYDLIALDPPSFGRGSSGQVWKIETDLPRLLECCRELRDPERPFNLVLSCHSPGFSLEVFSRMVRDIFGECRVEGEEMTIPESTGKVLPAGISCWCILN